jgi:hypothetical protein
VAFVAFVALRHCGIVALWHCGIVALWHLWHLWTLRTNCGTTIIDYALSVLLINTDIRLCIVLTR